MKKISVLIMLILCVAIGGVYAAWIYTGDNFQDFEQSLSSGMAQATTTSALGTIAVHKTDVSLTIDQKAEGDYDAVLLVSGTGFEVTFTPNPGHAGDAFDNFYLKATFVSHGSADNLYEGKEIYVPTSTEAIYIKMVKHEADEDINQVHYIGVLSASDVDTLVDLGGTFNLNEYKKWQDFYALEGNVTPTIVFSQATEEEVAAILAAQQ